MPSGSFAQSSSCLDIKVQDSIASVSGKLTAQLFAGPPNYESIAAGDAEERVLILELHSQMCADDNGEFADSATTFDRVQVSSSDPGLLKVLNAAIGRQVTISGRAFGAHTGHHHAPLVLFADKVIISGGGFR